MTIEEAREVAGTPDEHDWLVVVHALQLVCRELDRVEAHSLEQERLSTLGGIPPAFTPTWGNTVVGAGIHPDYVGRI